LNKITRLLLLRPGGLVQDQHRYCYNSTLWSLFLSRISAGLDNLLSVNFLLFEIHSMKEQLRLFWEKAGRKEALLASVEVN